MISRGYSTTLQKFLLNFEGIMARESFNDGVFLIGISPWQFSLTLISQYTLQTCRCSHICNRKWNRSWVQLLIILLLASQQRAGGNVNLLPVMYSVPLCPQENIRPSRTNCNCCLTGRLRSSNEAVNLLLLTAGIQICQYLKLTRACFLACELLVVLSVISHVCCTRETKSWSVFVFSHKTNNFFFNVYSGSCHVVCIQLIHLTERTG